MANGNEIKGVVFVLVIQYGTAFDLSKGYHGEWLKLDYGVVSGTMNKLICCGKFLI